jgi:ATP adenylyltransferase
LGYIQAKVPTQDSPADLPNWLDGANHECFLCRSAADTDHRRTLTVWHGQHSMVVLNRFPYSNGHLLVAPRYHKARLDDLSADEHLETIQTLARLTRVLERLMNCEGFNIGLNLGRVAGAGVPGHLHWHLVPRWQGDTNFMPVIAGTHVIPQALDELFDLLHRELR